MKRNLIIVVCTLFGVFLLGLTGMSLIDTKMREDSQRDDGQFIGVFITTEHLDLFDFEGYINDNANKLINGGSNIIEDNKKYQGRMYATLTNQTLTSEESREAISVKDYVFEGIEGMAFFAATVNGEHPYTTTGAHDGISDVIVNMASNNEGKTVKLGGTVYITPAIGIKTFYVNPVYQSKDGSVYVTTGNGFSNGGVSDGSSFSTSLDKSYEVTEKGKTKKNGTSAKITFQVITPPDTIEVIQMASNHTVILRKEYTPENMPESITPEKSTAYLVVEERNETKVESKVVGRNIYQRSDETLSTFLSREDGVCIKQNTVLKW